MLHPYKTKYTICYDPLLSNFTNCANMFKEIFFQRYNPQNIYRCITNKTLIYNLNMEQIISSHKNLKLVAQTIQPATREIMN